MLAPQVINVLFCKVFDEMDKGPEQYVDFRWGFGEDPEIVHLRLLDLFSSVKDRYGDIFAPGDGIEIDPVNLAYMVGELQNYAITEASRDAVGPAWPTPESAPRLTQTRVRVGRLRAARPAQVLAACSLRAPTGWCPRDLRPS
jgi:hypothetical protein